MQLHHSNSQSRQKPARSRRELKMVITRPRVASLKTKRDTSHWDLSMARNERARSRWHIKVMVGHVRPTREENDPLPSRGRVEWGPGVEVVHPALASRATNSIDRARVKWTPLFSARLAGSRSKWARDVVGIGLKCRPGSRAEINSPAPLERIQLEIGAP